MPAELIALEVDHVPELGERLIETDAVAPDGAVVEHEEHEVRPGRTVVVLRQLHEPSGGFVEECNAHAGGHIG